ncbi:hypothetical protein B6V88_08245 [Legionella micdadei]|nr:hypothetical protein B6V88_08245 [Legionella micdadei]
MNLYVPFPFPLINNGQPITKERCSLFYANYRLFCQSCKKFLLLINSKTFLEIIKAIARHFLNKFYKSTQLVFYLIPIYHLN